MTTTHIVSQSDLLWSRIAKFMREGGFSGWERIIVATDGEDIMGFCALIKQSGFQGQEYCPLVKWLFVDEKYRGKRLSERILPAASEYAAQLGFDKIYLTTWHVGLYEKYGFVRLCSKEVRALH